MGMMPEKVVESVELRGMAQSGRATTNATKHGTYVSTHLLSLLLHTSQRHFVNRSRPRTVRYRYRGGILRLSLGSALHDEEPPASRGDGMIMPVTAFVMIGLRRHNDEEG
jgi:hypothetical protein